MAKFKAGDTIVQRRAYWHGMLKNHVGMVGEVIELRTYHSYRPTHYLIKFTNFAIPHIFCINEIDECCEPYKVEKQ